MNLYKFKSFEYIIIFYFLLSYLSIFFDFFRLGKYLLPFVVLFLRPNLTFNYSSSAYLFSFSYIKKFLKLYFVIFTFFFLLQLIEYNLNERFFNNLLFVLLPLFFVFTLIRFIDPLRIKSYFFLISLLTILGYFIQKGQEILNVFLNLDSFFLAFINSNLESESGIYSFLLCLLFCYSIVFNKNKYFFNLIIFVLFILSFKRVAIFSVLIFFFFNYFDSISSFILKNKFKSSLFYSLIFLGVIIFYFYITSGVFDDFFIENFGISINAFLMGRQFLYDYVISQLPINQVFGTGIGSVDSLLLSNSVEVQNITNLHSELLRLFIELGFLFYFIWLFFFSNIFFINKFSISVLFMLSFIFLSDNVFIYFDTMFLVYLLIVFSIFNQYYDLSRLVKK